MEQTKDITEIWTPNNIAKTAINALKQLAPAGATMRESEFQASLTLGFSLALAFVISHLPATRKGRDEIFKETLDVLRDQYTELADKLDANRNLN